MAIALLMTFKADGRDPLALYDRCNEIMHAAGQPPEGLILHWAAKTPAGDLRVVDVWSSRGAFETFLREKLGPTAQQLEIAQPEIEELAVHNVIDGRVATRS